MQADLHQDMIKTAEDEATVLKAVRETQRVNYKWTPIGLPADFSTETAAGQKGVGKIYSKSWKGKICNLESSSQQDYHLE